MNKNLIIISAFVSIGSSVIAAPMAIPLSEVSGAVLIEGDRVALIADEGYQVQIVSNADSVFASGDSLGFETRMVPFAPATNGSKESKKIVDDIEDVAWDPQMKTLFAIASHSRSRKQDAVADASIDKPQRHKLARLSWKPDGTPVHEETSALEAALEGFPFIQAAMKQPHEAGGNGGTFNIEGLAFDSSRLHLLIGLRSPTQQHDGKPCAVVLALNNPHSLFETPSQPPELSTAVHFLDLGGLGIRGMTYDAEAKGCWIIAGRSADPDAPSDLVPASIWFWDLGDSNSGTIVIKKDVAIPADFNGEGICLLPRSGLPGLLLVSDDGGDAKASRYLWIAKPK